MKRTANRLQGRTGSQALACNGSPFGFTLLELLVVVAIVALLATLLVPALVKAKEQGRSSVCKANMRQLGLAMVLYADDDGDYLPWPGDVDRNWHPDWVFGGQNNNYPHQPEKWKSPGFGFHAESGSIFAYATGFQRVAPHRDEISGTFRIYHCPSAGLLGEALRVNFSMNEELDPTSGLPKTTAAGVRLANVVSPTQKILLINEDPATMKNASFKPGDTGLEGLFVAHEGRVNVGFIDGHLEAMRDKKVRDIQTASQQKRYFDPYYRE